MNVSEALEARRSIRYFEDREVPEETLRAIVKDAQWAPSWANAQPWKVYIATGDLAKRIRESHLQNAQRGLRGRSDIETGHRTDWGRKAYNNMGHWSDDLQGYLGMSVREFLTMHQDSPEWSIYDMGAFGQSLMLAAKERGVDSMAAYEIVKYPEAIRKLLPIPQDEAIVMGIALGYADGRKINGFRSDREPLENVLTIANK